MTKQKIFDIINYIFFSLVIITSLVLTIILKLNWLTFTCCAFSILYNVFLSDKNIINFVVGFLSSSTYVYICYVSKLYGEAIFYLAVDIPLIFVSFFMWKKHMETKFKVETKHLKIKHFLLISLIGACVVVGYGFLLKAIGGKNTFIDALSTVVALIATILMMLRFREQWFMWIVVCIVSVILWSTIFDLLMLIMSASCLLFSIFGFVNWSISNKKSPKKI